RTTPAVRERACAAGRLSGRSRAVPTRSGNHRLSHAYPFASAWFFRHNVRTRGAAPTPRNPGLAPGRSPRASRAGLNPRLMKFLCDRCKTRYSIADERVRGKILKIRCKNCGNVVSVREGMSEEDHGGDAPAGAGSALQSAFASVMTSTRPGDTQPPPAVLEEEWYVALDGAQSGPYSLAEAQDWVSPKKATDDLLSWCHGFDA